MKRFYLHHYLAGTVAALLAGCAAVGTPTTTNAMPSIAGTGAHHETSSDAFLYYDRGSAVYIYTYPQGDYVGVIGELDGTFGLCADNKGNVFVPVWNQAEVLEYAAGSTTLEATLSDKGYQPYSCAVDPVSGNLTVSNFESTEEQGPGSIAIYNGAKGNPTFYSSPEIINYTYCTYDGNGNLFVDGWTKSNSGSILAEMPAGGGSFSPINMDESVFLFPGNLQWDGHYLTITTSDSRKGPMSLYRLNVTSSGAKIAGKTILHSHGKNVNAYQLVQYWVQGNVVVGPNGHGDGQLALWHYPKGGKPFALIGHHAGYGVTISVALTGSRIRN